MINVPDHLPFRFIEEADSFVIEAQRKRGPNELCWCKSGHKYKKCHRDRSLKKPLALGEMLHKNDVIFWQTRECNHPLASSTECRLPIIDAHTIQRKGVLSKIIDSTNHVSRFELDPANPLQQAVSSLGWRKASVFPGFCSKHDTELFAPIEIVPFTGTHEQCVLQSYRAIANEVYKKKGLIRALQYQKENVDRGRPLDDQINFQMSINDAIEGHTKSLEELEQDKSAYEATILSRDFSQFKSRCYLFDGNLNVVSFGTLHAQYTFDGKMLADLWDLNIDVPSLTHSTMATDTGGAIVFCWPTNAQICEEIVDSFDKIPDQNKGDIFLQYCFVNSENTFFAKAWWDTLSPFNKQLLKKYAEALHYEGGAFKPLKDKLVNWSIKKSAAS